MSRSAYDTAKIGELLGTLIKSGDFISLRGELGAGKTCFAGGVASGLGIDKSLPVTSPTYTIMNHYQGRIELFHFDFYRLNGPDDIAELGFEDYFYSSGVCLVEWAERLSGEMPEQYILINFILLDVGCRSIQFEPHGARYNYLVEQLASLCKKWFDHALVS